MTKVTAKTLTMVDRLRVKFPRTFTSDDPRPLAIGITYSIFAALNVPEYSDKGRTVKSALEYWTRTDNYLRACVCGAIRVDLSGAPAGVVSDAEAKYAAMELQKREKEASDAR
jgi:sRNA-binding protein